MKPSFYRRYGWLIVTLCLLLLPLTVWSAGKTLQSTTNEARDWLPRHYPETIEYGWFTRHFGGDDFVLATWEGCTLDDPRLASFTAAIEVEAQRPASDALFSRILTGRSLLAQLTESGLRLQREQAVERLRGSLIGPDGQQTCAIVYLAEAGKRDLHRSIGSLQELAIANGVPREALHVGGLPVVNEAINVAGIETLKREAGLASVIGLLIAWRLFRTLRLTTAVAVTGLYSAAAALAMVWLSGVAMNSILITMAPLVFVAATSGAIHLANYYRDAVEQDGATGAAERAVRHAWTPLGLATATTAIGLLSLLYSDLSPIRQFGVFSAVGIVLGLALTVLFLPAVIVVWPFEERSRKASMDGSPAPRRLFAWDRLANPVVRHARGFTLAGLALLVGCGLPMFWMKTSVDIMRLFRHDAPILQDYAWLERNLGVLMPVEAIVRIPAGEQSLDVLEKLELVRDIEQAVQNTPRVGSSLSAAAFLPEASGGVGPAWLRRSVASRRLAREYARFEEHGFLAQGDGEELWRISLRVGPFADLDYELLLRDLRLQAAPVLERSAASSGISILFTGVMPVVHKARLSLLRDLLFGLATDLLLIFVAMIVLMRHWSSGLLLLLVSLLPTTVVFGVLVWMGVVVEIGALMAPCVALGVTVDDVIHFLLWFRRGIQQHMDRQQAVRLAYEGCARAMVQSWVILGLGLSVLLLSSFVPNVQFGAAMVALLTVGVAGNLFFLPALLSGPLGGIIARSVLAQSPQPAVPALEPT
jgi:predicted RND superfamily exporter protein